MATHSRILACRIPWAEEPSRLEFMGSPRVSRDWMTFTLTSCPKTVLSSISPLHPTVGLTSRRTRPREALRDTPVCKLLQEDFKRSLKHSKWTATQTHDRAYLVSQGGKKSGLTSQSLTLNQRHQKDRRVWISALPPIDSVAFHHSDPGSPFWCYKWSDNVSYL